MTGQKKKYKTSKIKSFLFFLLLALVIWTLTKFSVESTATINTNLEFSNLPNSVSVSPNTAAEIAFDISANGFQFLTYKLRPPTIDIDMSKYYEEGDTVVLISGTELSKIITSQLDNNTRVTNLSLDELGVRLDVMVSKKVPVVFVSDISYKEGYKLVGEASIRPDSVLLRGPSSELDSLTNVHTEAFVRKNVTETIEGSIGLQLPKNSNLSLSEEKVDIELVVDEFTQKRLVIPVELINVPGDIKLKLLTESIDISFDVSLSKFNSISEKDFRIVCDYATRSSEENILVPKLVAKPEGLYHIELSTRKVEYLIFK